MQRQMRCIYDVEKRPQLSENSERTWMEAEQTEGKVGVVGIGQKRSGKGVKCDNEMGAIWGRGAPLREGRIVRKDDCERDCEM